MEATTATATVIKNTNIFDFLSSPTGTVIIVIIAALLLFVLITGAKVHYSKDKGFSMEASEGGLFKKKQKKGNSSSGGAVNPFFIKVLKDVVDSEVSNFINAQKNEEYKFEKTIKNEKSFVSEGIKRNIEIKVGEIILVEDSTKNYEIYELYLARDLTKIILNHLDTFIERNNSNDNELDNLIVSEVDEIIKDLKIKVNKYTLLSQAYIEKIVSMYDKLGHDIIGLIQESVKKCIEAKNEYDSQIDAAKEHFNETIKEKIDSAMTVESSQPAKAEAKKDDE